MGGLVTDTASLTGAEKCQVANLTGVKHMELGLEAPRMVIRHCPNPGRLGNVLPSYHGIPSCEYDGPAHPGFSFFLFSLFRFSC